MCLFGINISVGPEIMLSLPVWLSNLYDSSISLLECKMQIFRKIRHFIYANNGKPTRPWKKVLVKVTSMHLTFDQAGFFSRADEARGKKKYECKWTCNMPPHFTARLCTIIGLQYYIVKKTMDDRGSHTQHVGPLSQQICMKDLTNTKFMWCSVPNPRVVLICPRTTWLFRDSEKQLRKQRLNYQHLSR